MKNNEYGQDFSELSERPAESKSEISESSEGKGSRKSSGSKLPSRIMSYVIIFLAVAVILSLFFSRYSLSYVPTTSMVPTIEAESLVISDRKAESYDIGDIAIYDRGDILVIHRIVAINDDGTYVFKGDNNDYADAESVSLNRIQSKYIAHSHIMGLIWKYLSGVSGLVMLVLIAVVWIIPSFLTGHGSGGKGSEKSDASAEKNESEISEADERNNSDGS